MIPSVTKFTFRFRRKKKPVRGRSRSRERVQSNISSPGSNSSDKENEHQKTKTDERFDPLANAKAKLANVSNLRFSNRLPRTRTKPKFETFLKFFDCDVLSDFFQPLSFTDNINDFFGKCPYLKDQYVTKSQKKRKSLDVRSSFESCTV